jgi:hypothetical protein
MYALLCILAGFVFAQFIAVLELFALPRNQHPG